MNWETQEVVNWMVNSHMAECNLPAEELEEIFEIAMPTPIGLVDSVLDSLLRSSLARIDWEEVAEAVSTGVEGEVECFVCRDSIQEEETSAHEWLYDDDGDWWCKDCREDYDNCGDCFCRLPNDDMVLGLCPDCAETMNTLDVGTIVNIPTDLNIATYDYGEIVELSTTIANVCWVCWFKWGYVPPEFRTPETVIYQTHLITDLVKVYVTPRMLKATDVPLIGGSHKNEVSEGTKVFHLPSNSNMTVVAIYRLLKIPIQVRFVCKDGEGKLRFVERNDCRV
jgi:hypothetical protein